MTKKQNAKLNMYRSVNIVCDANQLIWTILAAFVTAFGFFTSRLTRLIENARQQEELIQGYAQQKQLRKFTMATLATSVCYKIQAFAESIQDDVLLNKVNYTFNDIMKMRGNLARNASQTILLEAQAVIAALAPFGVLPADLTALDTAINDFSAVISMPRSAIAQVKTLTAEIKEDIAFIDKTLKKSMDKLMINFSVSSPAFYSDYFNSRIIVDAATSFTELDILVQDKISKAKISGVSVTVVGTTKTYNGSTDTAGALPLKKISPELYNLHFEIPGYLPLDVTGIDVSAGEHEKVLAELIPES
ncbi:MAG TPA: carboxypeptidase-like regulatory domain-containing protein [Bacteroidia bacterium]|nr:carboxypeptidase-like regulatory domain-containing protein [Bacteroidia bacterium]